MLTKGKEKAARRRLRLTSKALNQGADLCAGVAAPDNVYRILFPDINRRVFDIVADDAQTKRQNLQTLHEQHAVHLYGVETISAHGCI